MATKVRFSIPEREIEQTGITFRREIDGAGKHGELTVRKNDLEWRPKGNEFVFKIKWEKFADFAESEGRRIRPKVRPVRARKKLKAMPD